MKKKLGIEKVLLIDVVVFCIGFLIVSIMSQGVHFALANYIDVASIVGVLLFALPPFFASGMWKYFVRVFSIGKKPYTIAQMKQSLEAVDMLQKLFLTAGCFPIVIGIVGILKNVEDPAFIGPNLAVTILTGLMVMIFEFLLLPLKTHVQMALIEKMNLEAEADDEEPEVIRSPEPEAAMRVENIGDTKVIESTKKDEEKEYEER